MKPAITQMIAWIAAFSAAGAAHAADYRAEAEQIASEIVAIHPRGAEIGASPDFIAARDALLEKASDTDIPHYAVALGRMFHAADDGHTAVIPLYGEAPAFKHRYPLKLKRFEDGLYVVAAKGAAAPLLGGRITAIGGRKINPLLRDFASAQASGNRAWPANFTASGMTVPGYLIGLGAAESLATGVKFEVVLPAGKRAATLTASADGHDGLAEIARKASPLAALGVAAANYAAEIDAGRALVIVIGAMEDEDGKSFEQFTQEASEALKSTRASRVVIDLRDNGGGNNMLTEPLRRTLVKSRFNRPGGVYILTSTSTFSAAQNFATRLERETDAIFVGEPTGGAPNHFGDAKFARGPQSGLPYIISTLRWQDSTPFDKRDWISPDLPAPPAYRDYVDGRDAALAAALAHEADPVTDDWRGRVVSPWDRESQKQDWRFFYE